MAVDGIGRWMEIHIIMARKLQFADQIKGYEGPTSVNEEIPGKTRIKVDGLERTGSRAKRTRKKAKDR